MSASDHLGRQFLFHGTDAKLNVGDTLKEGSWATTRALTAGLYGERVYVVGKGKSAPKKLSLKRKERNVTSKGDLQVIKEIDNPHWTGECGRPNCDFSEHN